MEKRIIPACIANPRLNSLFTEVVSNNNQREFKIEIFDKDTLLRNELSFIIVDEDIYFEIIKKKVFFDKLILIKSSNKNIDHSSKESEIISLNIPIRFNDLYEIISNRIGLILSQRKRVQEFKTDH